MYIYIYIKNSHAMQDEGGLSKHVVKYRKKNRNCGRVYHFYSPNNLYAKQELKGFYNVIN